MKRFPRVLITRSTRPVVPRNSPGLIELPVSDQPAPPPAGVAQVRVPFAAMSLTNCVEEQVAGSAAKAVAVSEFPIKPAPAGTVPVVTRLLLLKPRVAAVVVIVSVVSSIGYRACAHLKHCGHDERSPIGGKGYLNRRLVLLTFPPGAYDLHIAIVIHADVKHRGSKEGIGVGWVGRGDSRQQDQLSQDCQHQIPHSVCLLPPKE